MLIYNVKIYGEKIDGFIVAPHFVLINLTLENSLLTKQVEQTFINRIFNYFPFSRHYLFVLF